MSADSPPRLLLLPGLDGTGQLFEPFCAALPAAIRTEVVTYPADKTLSLAEHAHIVTRRIDGTPTILLAESFSGLVALTLLNMPSHRVAGVIFCASFAEPPRPLLLPLATRVPYAGHMIQRPPELLLRLFCLGLSASPVQCRRLRDILKQVPPAVLRHRLALIGQRHDFGQGTVGVPCYFLQATQDRLIPRRAADWFARRFERFTLEPVDGPHFLLQAHPSDCAQRVGRIVTGLTRQAPTSE